MDVATAAQGRRLPPELLFCILDYFLDDTLDAILKTFRFIRSLRTTAHPAPTLGSATTTLCIEYPRLDLLPLLLTSRTILAYVESHPNFSRIYVYHPICHFKDINLLLADPATMEARVVPFTVSPLRSGNALYGFNKAGPSEAVEDIAVPRLRVGTVAELAEILVEFCGRTGLEEMSMLVRGDYLVGMIRSDQTMLGAWQRRMMKENMILEWARERAEA